MDKLDFVKQDKEFYLPASKPEIINVPAMQYLMYNGKGMPEDNPEFEGAFRALYGIAYALKFLPKTGKAPADFMDFKVPPPEGLWWMTHSLEFSQAKPEQWRWTLMLRMPGFVTKEIVEAVVKELVARKKDKIYSKVRLGVLDEGVSVQMMHIGPYEAEQASIAKMQALAEAGGYHFVGKHHEIYLGDPRRTKPEKLRTVIRHPVA